MAFDAHEDVVSELFNRKIYHVPRNQRRYVWDKDNWQELFDDVLCVVDGKLSSHFLGSIVLKKDPVTNGLPCFSVIDGQQRTITLAVFLSSIMYWMRRLGMENDFNGTRPYIVAKDDKNNDVIMVTAENNESLESIVRKIVDSPIDEIKKRSISSLVDGGILHKSDKNIGNAFKFFLNEINTFYQKNSKDKNKILELRDAVRNISFVNITATTEEDSYTIFEILNARGMDLEDHELLKNYIMRYIQPEENRDRAKTSWGEIEQKLGNTNLKKFVRHYTTHRYGTHRSKAATSDYKIIQECNKSKDTRTLLNDFVKKSDYYLKLVSPINSGEEANCTAKEYRIYSFFKKKRQEQMRPVLLSLITKNVEGELPEDLYNRTIEFLYNFYICYNIIGEENSNRLTSTVNKYADIICNDYSENTINDFVGELRKKLPSKEMFINAFKNVGWSHHGSIYEGEKNKERVQTILEVLERFKNHGNFCDDFTIEHVLPDSENSSNGQIGNLLPLEESLNNNCKDKTLNQKIDIYKASSFATTRNFAYRYEGKTFEPEKRTEYMAKEFYDSILKL